jgi:hypothetical protein
MSALITHSQGCNASSRKRPACINYVLDYGCFFRPVFLERYIVLVSREEGKQKDCSHRNANYLFRYVSSPQAADFNLQTALGYISNASAALAAIMTEAYFLYVTQPYWAIRCSKPMLPLDCALIEEDVRNPDLDPDSLIQNPTHYFHVRAARLGVPVTTAFLAMPHWLLEKYLSLVEWHSTNNNGDSLDHDIFGEAGAKQLEVLQRLGRTPTDLPPELNFQTQTSATTSLTQQVGGCKLCASYAADTDHCKCAAGNSGYIVNEQASITCNKCGDPMHGMECAYEIPFIITQVCYPCYSLLTENISKAMAALATKSTGQLERAAAQNNDQGGNSESQSDVSSGSEQDLGDSTTTHANKRNEKRQNNEEQSTVPGDIRRSERPKKPRRLS